jgi:hypothetical protein
MDPPIADWPRTRSAGSRGFEVRVEFSYRQTMRSLIWKWTQRVALTVLVAFMALYFGDMAVYRLRGSPQDHVHVNQTVLVPLKGNKQEYDYLGATDVSCSVSIFSQGGQDACWKLRRNQNKTTKM